MKHILCLAIAVFLCGTLHAVSLPSNVVCISIVVREFKESAINRLYTVPSTNNFYASIGASTNMSVLLANACASRLSISETLTSISKSAKQDELIVLHIFGHGFLQYNDLYFAPWDVDVRNLLGTGISFKQILCVLLDMCQRGANVIAVLDISDASAAIYNINEFTTVNGGISFLTACSPGETLYDFYGGGYDFSASICEALNGQADENNDSLITLREVYDYALRRSHEANIEINMVYNKINKQETKHSPDFRVPEPVLFGTLRSDIVLNSN